MTISIQDVSVRFGGVTAVNKVSLEVLPGRVTAVVGPNGSGKSTLFNSISGLVRLAEGSILVDGRTTAGMAPSDRVSLGIARTFQTPRFDPKENVEHAVLCGFYPRARSGLLATMLHLPWAAREEQELREGCRRILRDLNLFDLRDVPLGELSMGQVRLVEVARAIANEPRYLLLDEPAAGLSRYEQQVLADEIRRLARAGLGVLLVEHNFALVRELSEHVLVLDRGKPMLEGAPRDIEANQQFVSLYLGSTAKTH
ncbi:ABC transporter ATP-binding protein [Xanthobacter wiegelii]|uniref:ABC transporter ATP-binding protein n=1 Tax=Xanthobacter wiegelii TaxID=3119913 RepID=UPI003729EAE2